MRLALPVALSIAIVALHLPFVPPFAGSNRDGPMYINALKLDETYNVPATPGKIGFVLLAALALVFDANPVHAYAAVTIGLSVVAGVFIYLFAGLYLPPRLAAAASLAVMCGPLVAYYGSVIAAYIVWLPAFPAIGYFAIRYLRERKPSWLIAAAVTTGIASILRGDMMLFAGPLLVCTLVVGRAPLKYWAIAGGICVAASGVWFFSTAALSGGVRAYLALIQSQGSYHMAVGPADNALLPLITRNLAKYAMFLLWDAAALVILAMIFLVRATNVPRLPPDARERAIFVMWILPMTGFGIFVAMVTGGLIFPLLPLLAVAAGKGLLILFDQRERAAFRAMLAVAAACVLQFACSPILPNRNQRNVVINVIFTKHGGPGVMQGFYYNLVDFDINPSVGNVLRQLRAAEPVPAYPPDFRGPR